MTSTEIAKNETKMLAEYGDLMDDAPVVATDILIPKLLLMQPTSEFVSQEKAKSGDIVNSLGGDVLCPKGSKLEIIPFKCVKTWIKMKQTSGKPEFMGQEPYTMANAGTPRTEVDNDGNNIINYECINYYVLLPSEIAAGEFLPYVISFRSTSYKTGKKLETYRAKLADYKKPICFKTFELGSNLQENDQGRFYIYTVDQGRDTQEHELAEVKPWMERVRTQGVKVDESDLDNKGSEEKTVGSAPAESSREY